MILLKSILAGLIAVIVAAIVLPAGIAYYLVWTTHQVNRGRKSL